MREAPALLLLAILGSIAVSYLLLTAHPVKPPSVDLGRLFIHVAHGVNGSIVAANPYPTKVHAHIVYGDRSVETTLSAGGAAVLRVAARGLNWTGCVIPGMSVELGRPPSTLYYNPVTVPEPLAERLQACNASAVNASTVSKAHLTGATVGFVSFPGTYNTYWYIVVDLVGGFYRERYGGRVLQGLAYIINASSANLDLKLNGLKAPVAILPLDPARGYNLTIHCTSFIASFNIAASPGSLARYVIFWEDQWPRRSDDWCDHIVYVELTPSGYRVRILLAKGGYGHLFLVGINDEEFARLPEVVERLVKNHFVGGSDKVVYYKPFGARCPPDSVWDVRYGEWRDPRSYTFVVRPVLSILAPGPGILRYNLREAGLRGCINADRLVLPLPLDVYTLTAAYVTPTRPTPLHPYTVGPCEASIVNQTVLEPGETATLNLTGMGYTILASCNTNVTLEAPGYRLAIHGLGRRVMVENHGTIPCETWYKLLLSHPVSLLETRYASIALTAPKELNITADDTLIIQLKPR